MAKLFCNCVRQSDNATPNVCASREFERTEYLGRCVSDPYSAVVMGITRRVISGRPRVAAASQHTSCEDCAASSMIAFAKSDQVVSPAAVMWYVPPTVRIGGASTLCL